MDERTADGARAVVAALLREHLARHPDTEALRRRDAQFHAAVRASSDALAAMAAALLWRGWGEAMVAGIVRDALPQLLSDELLARHAARDATARLGAYLAGGRSIWH